MTWFRHSRNNLAMPMTRAFVLVAALLAAGSVRAQPAPSPSDAPPADDAAGSELPPPAPEQADLAAPQSGEEAGLEEACLEPDCGPLGPVRRWWHCRLKPCLQASHWGYRDEFEPRPFGTYMRAAGAAQVSAGLAAQQTLYSYDFAVIDGRPSPRLNAYGRQELVRLVDLASATGFPLLIERDDRQPGLNEARRRHVLAEVRRLQPDFPEERVLVGRPATRPFSAAEALEVDRNLLQQIRNGPSNSLGSGSAAGGTGPLLNGAAAGGTSSP